MEVGMSGDGHFNRDKSPRFWPGDGIASPIVNGKIMKV